MATGHVSENALQTPEKFCGSNGIRTHSFSDASAMLYQLCCEATLYLSRERNHYIHVNVN